MSKYVNKREHESAIEVCLVDVEIVYDEGYTNSVQKYTRRRPRCGETLEWDRFCMRGDFMNEDMCNSLLKRTRLALKC